MALSNNDVSKASGKVASIDIKIHKHSWRLPRTLANKFFCGATAKGYKMGPAQAPVPLWWDLNC
jgi:hypothetical protein